MYKLKNKTILLISPQSWGTMHVSKHHYAIELAKRGNIVYFINPPQKKIKFKIEILNTEYSNIFLVNYYYFLNFVRFHWRVLFDFCFKIQLKHLNKYIIKETERKIDIVWNFETNLLSDLSVFDSNLSIYHPVDNITGKNQKSLLNTSNFIFSVSKVIINRLRSVNSSKEITFINHGLSHYFIKPLNLQNNKSDNKISAYFVGNILINSLDRKTIKEIILQNQNIHFTFIGSYSKSNIGDDTDKKGDSFVSFLKNNNNVSLLGSLHPKDVAKEIQKADVFLILIDPQKDINNGSNSHKILEYLSTGKVIVSNNISTYSDKRNLIEMVDEIHNEKLPALFQKVINNLDYYNSTELQKKRIEFALDNTYEKQIERIEKIINIKIK